MARLEIYNCSWFSSITVKSFDVTMSEYRLYGGHHRKHWIEIPISKLAFLICLILLKFHGWIIILNHCVTIESNVYLNLI